MIAYVQGKLAEAEPTHAIVECGGIGYMVRISLNTYGEIREREQVKLYTFFQVREDAHVLYGFSRPDEREIFELLISVSGVGGNTALLILSGMTTADLGQTLHTGNLAALKRIKGIGEKTAARILLELKDKIRPAGTAVSAPLAQAGESAQNRSEALAALIRLGLPKAEMEKRLEKIEKEQGSGLSVEQMIKSALRNT